jgi:hypothetical protein
MARAFRAVPTAPVDGPQTGACARLPRRGGARNQCGQAVVIVVVALVSLLGMGALVVDVGSWFHTYRALQATADAAVLAGAQELPGDPSGAASLAVSYADLNGGGVDAGGISLSSTFMADDTISVHARKPASGFLATIFGIDSIDINARAKARAQIPNEVKYVAPMVVSDQHPLLAGGGCPCFGEGTSLDYGAMGAPGAFGMLNLSGGSGTVGTPVEAGWIEHGYDQYLPLGSYRSDPGAKFSSSLIRNALQARIGTVLLFPVFHSLTGSGQNASYLIVGWVGFRLASFAVHGNEATLNGEFTEYIATGIVSTRAPDEPYFGVRSIALVE